MSNYTAEAATYSGKVASFQAIVAQINSNLDSAKNKLSGTADSALKSNVCDSIANIKSQLESIVSEASANASKLAAEARRLDEENNKSLGLNTVSHTQTNILGVTEQESGTENELDVHLGDEENNKPKSQKAIDIHLGESPTNSVVTGSPLNTNNSKNGTGGLPRYV